ncbi:MAG TPA: TIGR00725 family protein [Dehalococcoidia bacterium]|nr:TIGR00725 family protein [Dehalococcoidia bacterium]
MISVIGGEACGPEALQAAEAVGRELGRRGATLVCGGRGGVMEAACRGAKDGGGQTVGIMPGRGPEDGTPNSYVDLPIYTGLGYARNITVVLSGEAVIAIDGSYGTLSELAYALIHDRPVVGIDTWDFNYRGFSGHDKIERVTDPIEAVERAIALAEERRATISE